MLDENPYEAPQAEADAPVNQPSAERETTPRWLDGIVVAIIVILLAITIQSLLMPVVH